MVGEELVLVDTEIGGLSRDTIELVVAHTDPAVKRINGGQALARLQVNEVAYVKAAQKLKGRQAEHAVKPKSSRESFTRNVEYTALDVDGAAARHTAKAQKETHQEAESVAQQINTAQVMRCYESKDSDARDGAGPDECAVPSEIAAHLRGIGVAVSEILSRPAFRLGHPAALVRRAFRVSHGRLVAVMSLAEAWAPHATLVYTHDAHRIDEREARAEGDESTGVLLFGRYMCDDRLSVAEEIALVRYLAATYSSKEEDKDLRACMLCLRKARFLTSPTMLVQLLETRGLAAVLKSIDTDARRALEEAIGPRSKRLNDALLPPRVGRAGRHV